MTMQKPLEALLRPPVEWTTSVSAWIVAFLFIMHPAIFLLSKSSAYYFALGFILFGLYRFKQGHRVYCYQKNLKRMPHYAITSKQLPTSDKKLFLGKGFLWTAQHTQRLRDLDINYNLHFKYPSRLKNWARQKELHWEKLPLLKQFAKILRINHFLNPFRPYPEIGGEPCIHGVSEQEESVAINLVERASHLLVLGLPGVGKTRFAELLISQDIHRGDVVIVLDPKGDADLLKRMAIEAKLSGREKDLLVFHLGFPESSCRYNPIGNFTRITEVANRISNQLPSSGDSAAFKEFGWQFINSIAMTLVAMGEKPDYLKMKFYITKMDVLLERYLDFFLPQSDPQYETWINDYIKKKTTEKREVSRLKALIAYVEYHKMIQNTIFDDLQSACRYDKEYFSKITASLGPLLKKLTTGKSAELLSPHYEDLQDRRPILDWLQVIRNKKIVYVGLDALTDPVVAAAVGNAMFSDLVSVAGRLYKFGLHDGFYSSSSRKTFLPRICLHSDEFNEIIGDEFIPLLNKARGAGFTVTAYTQTWSDVEARLKTSAKAGQVAGNIGTVVMFRCKEAATVEMLLNQLPSVPILRVVPASSSQDTPLGMDGIYYQSTNEDRFAHSEQRLIEQNDVLNLPKGQAFCLLEGGKLYKLRMPLPKQEKSVLPKSIEVLISN
ncbi:MAG: type IV conjugative transfer system coupling protein TraD, partial [Gammaproteobacteria bacterium]